MADVVRLFGQAMANDLVLTCRPFDARDDAAEMLEAMADEEAQSINREYIRKNLGR